MTWLLELLFDSIRTMCAQFVVDMMDMAAGVFTDLLSCDLSLFEELFSVAGALYRNAILPMSIALLIVICAWQLLKTMFGGLGTNAEEPVELVGRSMMCLFMVLNCKKLVDYLLAFAGTPYSWIVGSSLEIDSFSGFVSASELAAAALGIDTMSLQLLLLIMQFVVAWNYFKLLYAVAERYVLLGVFSYTAPLAFATGGSKATNNILANWAKMFGGQMVLIIMDAWGLKMYLAAYGNLLASRHGFTRFFVGCLCLVGFCKIMQKLDSYLASLGLNLGRTSPGMSGTALAIMAGRMLGRLGGSHRDAAAGGGSSSGTGVTSGTGGKSGKRAGGVSGEADFTGGSDPIPMSGRKPVGSAAKSSVPEGNAGGNGSVDGGYSNHADSQRAENGNKETGYRQSRKNDAAGTVEGKYGNPAGTGEMQSTVDGSGRSKGAGGNGCDKNETQKRKPDTGQGNEMDAGIRATYDEETWASMEEEAAAMDAAIDMVRAENPDMPETADGFDTGILSSGNGDADREGEIQPSDIGYHPQMWEAAESENVKAVGRGSAEHTVDDAAGESGLTMGGGNEAAAVKSERTGHSTGGGADRRNGSVTGSGQVIETGGEALSQTGIGYSGREDTSYPTEGVDAGDSAVQAAGSDRRQEGTGNRKPGNIRIGSGSEGNASEGVVNSSQIGTGMGQTGNRSGRKDTPKDTPSRFVRNGKLYLSSERYEAPEIPYQMEKRNGMDYYTVPESAATGGVQATLQENGSIRYSHGNERGWEPTPKRGPRTDGEIFESGKGAQKQSCSTMQEKDEPLSPDGGQEL